MSGPGQHALSAGDAEANSKVGYRHPPEEHRFKKGVSGNPKGRPRMSDGAGLPSEWLGIVSKVTGRKIRLTENGIPRTATAFEGVLRVVEAKAMKGDMHAARLYLEAKKGAEQEIRRDRQRSYDRQLRYKSHMAEKIRQCELDGFAPLDPVPHPDDMQVDPARELVTIHGPANAAQKVEWDESEGSRVELTDFIAHLRNVLTGPENGLTGYEGSRALVLELLEETREQLAKLDAVYPLKTKRRQPGYIGDLSRQQKGANRRSVSRPTPPAAEAAGGEDVADQAKEQSSLGQIDQVLTSIEKGIASVGDAPEPVSAKATRKITKAERDKILAQRHELKKQIEQLRGQLDRPEQGFGYEFTHRLRLQGLLQDAKKEFCKLDDVLLGDSVQEWNAVDGGIDHAIKAVWDRSQQVRSVATREIKYFQQMLAGPDHALQEQGSTREDMELSLKRAEEDLELVDAFYPAIDQRLRPRFDLRKWRKQKGKGKEFPRYL